MQEGNIKSYKDHKQGWVRSLKRHLTWDGLLPWLGYLWIWLFAYGGDFNDDLVELCFTIIVPVVLGLIRAGIGTGAMRDGRLQLVKRWRRVLHQFLFGIALVALMLFEVLAAMLGFSDDIPAFVCVTSLVFYGLYLMLVLTSEWLVKIEQNKNYKT